MAQKLTPYIPKHPQHPWKGWQEHHRLHKREIDLMIKKLEDGEEI